MSYKENLSEFFDLATIFRPVWEQKIGEDPKPEMKEPQPEDETSLTDTAKDQA